MAYSVEIKGLQEMQKRLDKVVSDLRGEPMLRAMRDATLMVTRDARINAPVDTGRLRASITPEVNVSGPDLIGIVGSNIKYAPIQELGIPRSYVIWPHHGVLVFKIGGKTIFAKYVVHPAMEGKRFLQRAFDSNKDKIEARFKQAIAEMLRGQA
jgi:HK97 gp10 family phage protein